MLSNSEEEGRKEDIFSVFCQRLQLHPSSNVGKRNIASNPTEYMKILGGGGGGNRQPVKRPQYKLAKKH